MFFASQCGLCNGPGPTPCRGCVSLLGLAGPVACPPGLTVCQAVLAYEGAGRDLVLALKYGNCRALCRPLGRAMAALVAGPVDVVTWVPTTPERRRRRGFDQAQMLARNVARALGRPCRRTLRRLPGPPQTGRDLAERHLGPALVARGPVRGSVLVVDDVVTTGATLAAAAAALATSGAGRVVGVTAAATSLKAGARAAEELGIHRPPTERGQWLCR